MIVDGGGNIVDFLPWGWTGAQIAGMSPVVNGFSVTIGSEWLGDGVPNNSTTSLSIQRQGSTDNDGAADFTWTSPMSMAAQNTGLTIPFSGGSTPVTISPTTTGSFVNGVWTGTVAVLEEVTDVYLAADDGSGHTGDSNTFDVDPYPGPRILNVTSAHADGAFTVGEVIDVDVVFDQAVTVAGGTPTLELETGSVDYAAALVGGNGTATLTFQYTVLAGDRSDDLDYTGTGAFQLNGATIRDQASGTFDAVVTLPAPSDTGSLAANKAIAIDTAGPVADTVIPVSGQTISVDSVDIEVIFLEPVTVSGSAMQLSGSASAAPYGNASVAAPVDLGGGMAWQFSVAGLSGGTLDVTLDPNEVLDVAGNALSASAWSYTIAAPTLSAEPPTTLGTANTVNWADVAGMDAYYAEYDTVDTFASPDANSGWIASLSHEFTGLSFGETYYYRVRGGSEVAATTGSWTQTTQPQFEAAGNVPTDVSTTNSPGAVTLAGGTSSDVSIVSSDASDIQSATSYFNIHEATADTTLTQIEVYLDLTTSVPLEFVVYRSSTFSGTYERISRTEIINPGTGLGFYSSGTISVSILSGYYYIIGVAHNESVLQYYSSGTYSTTFSNLEGYDSTTSYPAPSTLVSPSTSTFIFYHKYTTGDATGYSPSGTFVSEEITDSPLNEWGTLTFNATTPGSTTLTVDVLPLAGSTPIAGFTGVSSGTDLSPIAETSIRLRANLATSDTGVTPSLQDWSVDWEKTALSYTPTAWSNVEWSMQASDDVTPPTVTGTTPANGETVTASTVNIDVAFSEQVSVAAAGAMALSGTAAGSAAVGTPTDEGGNTWQFVVTGLVDGTLNVSLGGTANTVEDLAGNDLEPSPAAWSYTVAVPALPVYYVDSSKPDNTGDGLSWANAKKNVWAGVHATTSPHQVWVKAGTYSETISMYSTSDVEVYGGFAGTETSREQRSVAENVATLDAGALTAPTQVIAMYSTANVRIDGLTIRGGNANGANPMDKGGGLYLDGVDSTNVITGCTIVANHASRGGGIYCDDSSPIVQDCVIDRNSGGGMVCYYGSSPTITGSTMNGNTEDVGPGLYCYSGSSPTLTICSISGNVATLYSGGVYCQNSAPVFLRCTISGNKASVGAGAYLVSCSPPPSFTNCLISGNTATAITGGGVRCDSASPTFTNCTIGGNSATSWGGGVYCTNDSDPSFTNTLFAGNAAYAVAETANSDAALTNCLFFGNPDGDLLDEGTTPVNGEAAINALAGNSGNVDGNPGFLMDSPASIAGSWTAAPIYDSGTNSTTLTDSANPFTPDSLVGRLLNADTSQSAQVLIVSNTSSEVVVAGDATGYVTSSDTYKVVDYRLVSPSAAVDTGTGAGAPATDIEGNLRPVDVPGIGADGTGTEYDIGAYEQTLSSSSTVEAHSVPQTDLDLPDWNDTEAEKMTVLKFKITDHGDDGADTLVDQLTIAISGTGTEAANDIAWAELVREGSGQVATAAAITNTQIVFGATPDGNGTAALDTVTDTTSNEYSVNVYMNGTLAGAHGATYVFDIDESLVAVDGPSSSPMAVDSGAVQPVTGTLFVTQLGISLDADAWVIGPLGLNDVVGWQDFTVTNDSNVAVDIAIVGTDGQGGWSLSGTAGLDAFRVEVDADGDEAADVDLNTAVQTLYNGVGVSEGMTFGLRYNAPASDTKGGGQDQSFSVVVSVSAP